MLVRLRVFNLLWRWQCTSHPIPGAHVQKLWLKDYTPFRRSICNTFAQSLCTASQVDWQTLIPGSSAYQTAWFGKQKTCRWVSAAAVIGLNISSTYKDAGCDSSLEILCSEQFSHFLILLCSPSALSPSFFFFVRVLLLKWIPFHPCNL